MSEDQNKEPSDPRPTPFDAMWRAMITTWGRVFNHPAFWLGGFGAGFCGVVFAWFWVEGPPPYRLLIGVHYFFYLWLGAGYLSARLALRREGQ